MEVQCGFQISERLNLNPNPICSHYIYIYYSFAEDIKALRDIWLVGDAFMRTLWPTILATKNRSAKNKSNHRPYLVEFFNVIPGFPSANSCKSTSARIANQVTELLNENDWLPKYIVIMPDKNIIEYVKFGGFGCKVIFENTLEWISKAIEEDVELRCEDLKFKNPGACLHDDQPIILWVKMPSCPYIRNTNKGYVFAQCTTFNKIMEVTVKRFKNARCVQVEFPEDKMPYFNLTGYLNGVGKSYFWRELNRIIRRLENKPVDDEGKLIEENNPVQHHTFKKQEIQAALYRLQRNTSVNRQNNYRDKDEQSEIQQWDLRKAFHSFKRK